MGIQIKSGRMVRYRALSATITLALARTHTRTLPLAVTLAVAAPLPLSLALALALARHATLAGPRIEHRRSGRRVSSRDGRPGSLKREPIFFRGSSQWLSLKLYTSHEPVTFTIKCNNGNRKLQRHDGQPRGIDVRHSKG